MPRHQKPKSRKGIGGRKTIYTPELAQKICKRIARGESVRAICKEPEMPNLDTVLRWAMDAEHEFYGHYRRARDLRTELYADEIVEIADAAVDRDTAAAARVRCGARQWVASKLLPKTYGDRVHQQIDVRVSHADAVREIEERRAQRIEPVRPLQIAAGAETEPGDTGGDEG